MGFDIGIDLGTSSILVYIKGQGIVLTEPSVIALDKETNEILAVGEEAKKMLGKTPNDIIAIRPLREGVISDFNTAERMLRYYIKKAMPRHSLRKPRVAICVPTKVTEVERRAVEETARQIGAREVYVIEEPIAAAIGAGIDISRPSGSMIVDIGGGTTDIAVISLGGSVISSSIKIGGDNFDEAIINYMKRTYNFLIGEQTAEEVKITLGCAVRGMQESEMEVRGRHLKSGFPGFILIHTHDIVEAITELVNDIIEAIHYVLDLTPPELAADIYDRGIILTGGGGTLFGLDKAITEYTKINTFVAKDAINCVAIGTGKYIEFITEKSKSEIRN